MADNLSTAYLSLGCNMGDCHENLTAALRKLDALDNIQVMKVSSLYVTEPVGNPYQPDFLNVAAGLRTGMAPLELLEACQRVEIELGGRNDRVSGGPRTIDIDILLYGKAEIAQTGLMLPHPRMFERAFVLVPLAEIAPDAGLPGGGTVAHALARLSDPHRVKKDGRLML